MDQKFQALESDVRRLNETIASLTFRVLGLEKKIIELTERLASKKEKGVGIPVWESYVNAFKKRYNFEPPRNAKVNKACADIASRLGADAPAVAAFYVLNINDPSWMRLNHPIGILLANCESVWTMWKRGGMSSASDARRITNVNASQSYLQKKHGGGHEQR